MSWGSYGHPLVRLDYHALNTALHDRAKNKRFKHPDILPVYARDSVTAYRLDGTTIALKLYNTEIIHYHADGLRTLYGEGWTDRPTTRHWFWEARIRIEGIKPNAWSPKQYVVRDITQGVFYDGMQVDSEGQVVSEHKPMLVRKPNAEAKELRKRLTALGKIYRTFALMHGTSPEQQFGVNQQVYDLSSIDPTTHKFDLDLYKELIRGDWTSPPPYQRVQQTLRDEYENEVNRRGLFEILQGDES